MRYPTKEEVDAANHEQLCRWWRFLPSPKVSGELGLLNRISDRFNALGGFTPELSKKIGFEE